MNAALTSALDAKKNKAGDRVEARTTQDVKQGRNVVLPKGTRLVGHVTQAQARGSGQSNSALGVAFDRAELRDGQQVPLNVGIQALAASQGALEGAAGGVGDDFGAGGAVGGTGGAATGTVTNVAGSAGSVAGGAVGGATGVVGATAGAASRSTGAVGGLNSTGVLQSNSRGVFGLEGLSLQGAASNATDGSVVSSTSQNVHLASGTQMVLRAASPR